MTDILTSMMDEKPIRGQILKGPSLRRHRSPAEKLRIVEETYVPGVMVSSSLASTGLHRTNYSRGAVLRLKAL